MGSETMICNWCESEREVRGVLGVLLCEYCRMHWLMTGTSRAAKQWRWWHVDNH